MFTETLPKISCVMVTTGRPSLVDRSVQCFLRQTYENKELIILTQGPINKIEHPQIVVVEAPKFLSLGAMRNASVELTTGEVICQWDDDDLYDRDRLLTQYKALKNEDAVASLYTQFIKYFETTGEMYWVDWSQEHNFSHRFLCGTIMFHKTWFYEWKNILYPEKGVQSDVEEDLKVLEKLMVKGKIAAVDQGHQYIYSFHGQNTYDLQHHLLGIDTTWKKTLKTEEELRHLQRFLQENLTQYGLPTYHFRGQKEVAFSY